jgi:hypothetical protein
MDTEPWFELRMWFGSSLSLVRIGHLCDLGGEKAKSGHGAHGNGHGHVWVYARLRHIKGAMHVPDYRYAAGLHSMCQVARLHCSAADWILR